MSRYYNRASSLSGLRDLARQHGADLPAAMAAAGLGMELLGKPDERIDFHKVCALFEHCAQAWAMPDFGLRLAPCQNLDVLGPIGLVTRIERDLRSALGAIIDNLVIHSNALVAVLEEENGVASITVDTLAGPAGVRQYMLLSLGVARNVIEQAEGSGIELIEAGFRGEARGLQAAAEQYFRCPVRFGAERNAIYFDASVLDRPMARSDTAFHAIINRYLTSSRHESGGQISDSARQEIARQMEFGACTLDSVAQRLRLEPRSFQRRLKQEGTAFRSLVDDWRRTRALSLVTRTRLPMSEITLALGYSDQSIFSRAFQRWYGETPLAFRQRGGAGGAAGQAS